MTKYKFHPSDIPAIALATYVFGLEGTLSVIEFMNGSGTLGAIYGCLAIASIIFGIIYCLTSHWKREFDEDFNDQLKIQMRMIEDAGKQLQSQFNRLTELKAAMPKPEAAKQKPVSKQSSRKPNIGNKAGV